jgi:hypothetical protein
MKEKTIIIKDGVKLDLSTLSEEWIDEEILGKEMQYISRMTEGLTTGTMSSDKEYILLKNKVVDEMIKNKVVSLKKELCEAAKKKTDIYDQADMIQAQALQRIQDNARAVARENDREMPIDKLKDIVTKYNLKDPALDCIADHPNIEKVAGKVQKKTIKKKKVKKKILKKKIARKKIVKKKVTKKRDRR